MQDQILDNEWLNQLSYYILFLRTGKDLDNGLIVKTVTGIGITFFSMCQMAPSILFQWDISNFNGPFDNLNAPKGRKWDMAF